MRPRKVAVYLSNKKHVFRLACTEIAAEGNYLFLYSTEPSESNPYNSRSPRGRQEVARFHANHVSAIVWDSADELED